MGTFQIDFGEQEQPLIVGIDLGTTNSLVAHLDAGIPEVIPGPDGDPLVPSIVSMPASGGVLVGNPARAALLTSPAETIQGVTSQCGAAEAEQIGYLLLDIIADSYAR